MKRIEEEEEEEEMKIRENEGREKRLSSGSRDERCR